MYFFRQEMAKLQPKLVSANSPASPLPLLIIKGAMSFVVISK
jgi:hypothetical protein